MKKVFRRKQFPFVLVGRYGLNEVLGRLGGRLSTVYLMNVCSWNSVPAIHNVNNAASNASN
ncbi:hypothetical protein DPMN_115441 [Dreissena polymorpha]|uniref:Uncharacterized protein n=1 Tax=Dreissena polymorpha TaxID=45954 RepID=A0A9D4KM17_DREPO|nr:hypothetical protein DPMN_115441 [Dreissena polymorpha]